MNTLPKNTPIVIGQYIYSGLYNRGYGIVHAIHGEQSPGSCRSIFGSVGTMGGNATFDIVFLSGHSTHLLPECILRGVQWDILDKIASPEEVADAVRNAAEYEATQKRKADDATARRARERAEHLANNPHLTPAAGANMRGSKIAAANIRIELKRHFPGIKFSVTSDGNSVRIGWENGPTNDQVELIAYRHKQGSFDGMTDSYEFSQDATFADVFGGVQYVFATREATVEGYRLAWILDGRDGADIADDIRENGWRDNRQLLEDVRRKWYETDLRPDQYAAALVSKFSHA